MLEDYHIPPARLCGKINFTTLSQNRFRSRKIQFEIFGKRRSLEIGSIPSTSGFSCQMLSINAPRSSSAYYFKFESWTFFYLPEHCSLSEDI